MMKTTPELRILFKLIVVGLFLLISIMCCTPESNPSRKPRGMNSSALTLRIIKEDHMRREEYVNTAGNITFASDKHYAVVIKELDEDGHVVSEYFYDENGEPAKMTDGQEGILREYDEQGREIKLTYVNDHGEPVRISSGFASVLRLYDENGNKVEDRYADQQGNPIYREGRYAARKYEYNKEGQNVKITYLGFNDIVVRSSYGYAVQERTFDESNRVSIVMFFGIDSNPASGRLGQYGEKYEYDELGRKYKTTYLDQAGRAMLNTDGYATETKKYKQDNSTDSVMYYDTEGKPIRLSHGEYGRRYSNGRTLYLNKWGYVSFLLSLSTLLHSNAWAVVLVGIILCLAAAFLPRFLNILLLACYFFFIIYMTLMYRAEGMLTGKFEFLWSYKRFFYSRATRVEILQNIWLFVPFGMLLYQSFRKRWLMIVPFLFSIGIEITQYYTGRGYFEFDDMINNGLGGCIGFWIEDVICYIIYRIECFSNRFSKICGKKRS